MKEDPKKPKATPAKKKSATTKAANPVKRTAKASKLLDAKPLMSTDASLKHTITASSRRNKSTVINRTDRYKNIEDGLVPFKYSVGTENRANLDVRDTVILCQKAYYNFSAFRNTIDLMTEFSSSSVYYRGGSKKSRDFFEAFFNKVGLWSLQDRFFREYYRSGNVFIYRFDGSVSSEDVKRITQTFGNYSKASVTLPIRYTILNPADIQISGGLSFSKNSYNKIITDYELARLQSPRTEEDKQILDTLSPEMRETLKKKKTAALSMPLDADQVVAVFYKKQDYEPFSVPMGYPVLEDINWKQEMKKMDMAVARTMQQAILLVTMGAEPEKGGVNQRNLEAMQQLFENESVGRVLISDYTTEAKFVIPDIGNLLGPQKYEVVENDIQMGLNNILVGGEKFANQAIKTEVFLARLNQGRQAFLNEFLVPEIKRMSKALGFKNYPTPYFEEVALGDDANQSRVYNRLVELGVLTPEEGIIALETGRLPDNDESLESQRKFKDLRDQGLYQPIMKKEGAGGDETGRPSGTEGIPQETKDVSPIGQGEQSKANFSLKKVTDNLLAANKLQKVVEARLREKHNRKRLSKKQKEVAESITSIIVSNEPPEYWTSKAQDYIDDPSDKNESRVNEISDLAVEHQVNDYLASILYASKK